MNILLVEDDEDDAVLIQKYVRQMSQRDVSITLVDTLEDALGEMLGDFDAVLLDLGLPDSQGIESVEKVQRKFPDIPLVVLTGNEDDELGVQAVRAGAQDHLVKYYITGSLILKTLDYAIERKKQEGAVRSAQKFEAIGRLTGGVAHDFNNLLTIINGHANLLSEASDPQAIQEQIQQIKIAGEEGATLVRQLLAFSRQQVIVPVNLDSGILIKDTIPLIQRLVGEAIQIDLELDEEAKVVRIDPTQLQQVLLNVASNARDAMPNGGRFVLKIEEIEVDQEEAEAGPLKVGSYVQISARDTGRGMDAEIQERAFDPFFTTKQVGEGTGLGLSSVYGIVTQNEGRISVESQAGVGTTFFICLPKADQVAEANVDQHEKANESEEIRSGQETILVVEDNPGVRDVILLTLEMYGYNIIEAENGEEALVKLAENKNQIRLVVTDLMMPKMGGREFVEQARVAHPELAAIYVSAYSKDEYFTKGQLGERDQFLSKPFDPKDLARMVGGVLDGIGH